MATVQCGAPPTRATHVTMPARLLVLQGDVLQCGAAGAGCRCEGQAWGCVGTRPTCHLALAPFWRAAMAAFREVPRRFRGFWQGCGSNIRTLLEQVC